MDNRRVHVTRVVVIVTAILVGCAEKRALAAAAVRCRNCILVTQAEVGGTTSEMIASVSKRSNGGRRPAVGH